LGSAAAFAGGCFTGCDKILGMIRRPAIRKEKTNGGG